MNRTQRRIAEKTARRKSPGLKAPAGDMPVQIGVAYDPTKGKVLTRYSFPVNNLTQSPEEALAQARSLLEAVEKLQPHLVQGYNWPRAN